MKAIHIDRKRRLRDDPGTGHNRWHPDIERLEEPIFLSFADFEAVVQLMQLSTLFSALCNQWTTYVLREARIFVK